jgi:hypothetical protein
METKDKVKETNSLAIDVLKMMALIIIPQAHSLLSEALILI